LSAGTKTQDSLDSDESKRFSKQMLWRSRTVSARKLMPPVALDGSFRM
jgi:hypothetical protein